MTNVRSNFYHKNFIMKTRLILFVIIIFALSFYQCHKEKALATSPNQEVKVTKIAFDAMSFINHFKADKTVFSGIVVKSSKGKLDFEKISIDNNHFVRNKLAKQPNPINWTDIPFQFWQPEFEFAYFSWEELELIANNSEKIYFSGAAIILGSNIHDEEGTNSRHFTFKLEGDYKKSISKKETKNLIPNPMVLFGTPCPPEWNPN